jgi:hypothetical protein
VRKKKPEMSEMGAAVRIGNDTLKWKIGKIVSENTTMATSRYGCQSMDPVLVAQVLTRFASGRSWSALKGVALHKHESWVHI